MAVISFDSQYIFYEEPPKHAFEKKLRFRFKELSATSLSHLKEAFHNGKEWEAVLHRAQEVQRLPTFDKEVLIRMVPSLLTEINIIQAIGRIFKENNENTIDIFLRLATTYRSSYYTHQEFIDLVKDFTQFTEAIGKVRLPAYGNEVPCYDQGGKNWLLRCIATLEQSNLIQDQVKLWTRLPSRTEIQHARSLKFGIFHAQIFKNALVEKNLDPNSSNIVSFQNFFTTTIRKLSKEEPRHHLDKYFEVGQLLEHSCEEKIFQESDCIHIFQILASIKPSSKTKFVKGNEKALIYWYTVVSQMFGDAIFSFVSNPASYQKKASVQQIILLLQSLVEINDLQKTNIFPLLTQFYRAEISLPKLLLELDRIKNTINKSAERNSKALLQAFSSTDKTSLISVPLAKDELREIIQEYEEIQRIGEKLRQNSIADLIKQTAEIRDLKTIKTINRQEKLTLVAIAREAIRIKMGIVPYDTQVLALLGILHHPATFKGRIAQVRAGEGKSTIITMLVFYHAALNQMVDCISSNRYLARRDYEKYKDLFQTFGFTTSHICTDNPNEKNFSGQIIFGTNYDFEFALLKDYLHENGSRKATKDCIVTPRPFDVVLVDEVDNLFIDSGLNSARIAIPGKAKYSWIYQPILSFVRSKKAIKTEEKDELVNSLTVELSTVQEGKFKDSLSKLSVKKLKLWIESANKALKMKPKEDYVIKPIKDRSGEREAKNKIVIVDKKNTGRLQEGSRWQYGLHEFLEAKHDLPIKEENMMPASICHPLYFGQYSYIYGLSGTLGTPVERGEIQQIYGVDTFDVPPHKPNRRVILSPKILFSREDYYKEILFDINTMVEQRRPVLCLFETIQETEDFGIYLKQKGIFFQLLNERQAENEDFIIARAGSPCMVTVATNTAGRGTDIILHPDSLGNGGLHVVFAFEAENERIEEQGVCRGGRQGQPGSARKILYMGELKHLSNDVQAILQQMQLLRDESTSRLSVQRIQRTKVERLKHDYLQTFIKKLRVWRESINHEFFARIQKRLKNISPDIEENDSRFKNTLFLETIKDRLHSKILQAWAENFYDQLDEIYESMQMSKAKDQDDLEKIYKQEIEKLYLSSKDTWENYLLSPEESFLRYLEQIDSLS